MMDWQPIETAPKDGTRFDLWMVDEDGRGCRVADAYWVASAEDRQIHYAEDGSHSFVNVTRSGWFAPYHDYEDDGFCDYPKRFNAHPNQRKWIWRQPTHWAIVTPPEA